MSRLTLPYDDLTIMNAMIDSLENLKGWPDGALELLKSVIKDDKFEQVTKGAKIARDDHDLIQKILRKIVRTLWFRLQTCTTE